MSVVRTILGDIAPAALGVCYAHEHVVIDDCYATQAFPDFRLTDLDKIAAELLTFHAAGGRAMIDAMPGDAGRNLQKLADVSRRTGVHIVAPTGLHLAKYYPPDHWSHRPDLAKTAAAFVADIHDRQCGVIKVASSRDRLTDREHVAFAAASAAHVSTGCPILTHTDEGTAALDQIDVFRQHGVDLRHVCLSHTDRKPDLSYHRDILSSGVRIEFDSCFRWKQPPNHSLELVVALIEEFPGQIMLGMDAARPGYWRSFGGTPGLDFLLTTFTARLKQRGVTDEQLRKIFVTTPASTFSFAEV